MGRTAKFDWRTIERDYIEGGETLAQLGDRYRAPLGSMRKHSATGKWKQKRAKHRQSRRKKGKTVASKKSAAKKATVVVPRREEDDLFERERVGRLRSLELALMQVYEQQVKRMLSRL